jgi:DNA-directed RNA polymerase specialized sigma24 family protein
MADDDSAGVPRLNSLDRHGRQIAPEVFAAAEAVFSRALRHGTKLLGDPAVVVNILEEVAATVSQRLLRGDPPGEATATRNLAGYVFRAFVRRVNRLKNKEHALLHAVIARSAATPKSADPSRQFEMQILLREYLARFSFEEKDMCWRRLEGYAWDEIGKLQGISGHAARERLRTAVKRVKAELAEKKGKKSLPSGAQAGQNEELKPAPRTDVKKKATTA